MKKYRIKECTMIDGSVKYMPQEKVFIFWVDSLINPKTSIKETKDIIRIFKNNNIVSTRVLNNE